MRDVLVWLRLLAFAVTVPVAAAAAECGDTVTCIASEDCPDDGDECTTSVCDVADGIGHCKIVPLFPCACETDARCEDCRAYTANVCHPTDQVCMFLTYGAPCDPVEASSCDDGDPCTSDWCDPLVSACVHVPSGEGTSGCECGGTSCPPPPDVETIADDVVETLVAEPAPFVVEEENDGTVVAEPVLTAVEEEADPTVVAEPVPTAVEEDAHPTADHAARHVPDVRGAGTSEASSGGCASTVAHAEGRAAGAVVFAFALWTLRRRGWQVRLAHEARRSRR